MSSGEQYLDAGFDPQGLKMSAIRNILNKHSVEFPSNAKKSELLGILQRGVLDQASKLRKEAKKQKRVKGDGRDIEVMAPAAGVSAIGERTRARTPKPVERTRPPMVKRDTKDEATTMTTTTTTTTTTAAASAVKAPATPVAKAPAKPITRPPVTPVSRPPTTPVARAPATPIARAPATPTARPLGTASARAPVTPISRPAAKTSARVPPTSSSTRAPAVASALDKDKDKAKKKTRKIRPAAREPRAAAESPPAKPTMDKATAVKAGAKRKLSDAEESRAVDSGDDEFFTPAKARISEAQRLRIAKHRQGEQPSDSPSERPRKHVTASKERAKPGNFSDENPFQSSPETARKRRRKADEKQPSADAGPVTPMGALRKSQVSDLSFKVALPRAAPAPEPEKASGPSPGVDLDLAQHEDLDGPDLALDLDEPELGPQQQQQQPAALAPPKFSLAPPLASAPSTRFTMTPDALRQLASANQQAPPLVQPQHHRRATTNQISQISRLPPVAPRIAVAPRNPLAPRVAPPTGDSDGDSDGDLQRRRVATLRQHVEGARAGSHSRRSSVASTISESRGATAIPSRAARDRVARTEPQFKRKRRGALRAVAAWVGVAAAALAAWRTHEQWSLGFGNARAELAFQPAPAGSALPAMPDAPAGPDVADQLKYWAQCARAYVQPQPMSCPEHAECVPHLPLHAWRAAEPGPRDQWVVAAANQRVAAVQCDAGHVISFSALAPRWLPRVPACVRDASTELRVHALADALVAECEAHRGRVKCAGSVVDYARPLLMRWLGSAPAEPAQMDEADEVERLGVSVADLRRAVAAVRSPLLGDDDFDALFRLAVDELEKHRDSDVSHYVLEYEEEGEDEGGSGVEKSFFVARRAEQPLLCRARCLALDVMLGNLPGMLAGVGLLVVALVVSRRMAARRAERRAADALVGSALRRLKRQARRHYLDPALSPSPAIPSLQLRDLLLLAGGGAGPNSLPDTPELEGNGPVTVYYDPRARAGVWDRVRAVVERSANVRCRTTAVRGEPMRVWEWIGPLDDEEDMDAFSPFGSPFASPQRVLSPGPL
ncbi:inner nuclear membrane protein enriched at telomere/subtelomere region [Coemansia sp. S146]|nr:inner nuclear membrane protein enriched at telomere/subtelomere region [Coemansia sp. S146]